MPQQFKGLCELTLLVEHRDQVVTRGEPEPPIDLWVEQVYTFLVELESFRNPVLLKADAAEKALDLAYGVLVADSLVDSDLALAKRCCFSRVAHQSELVHALELEQMS